MGLFVLAGFATLSGQPASAPVALRFHHLHYRVADPGAALGDAAEMFKGARTILQGLGVGLLPALVCTDAEGVRYVEASPPPPARLVSALVRRGAARRPALAAVLEALAECRPTSTAH